MAKKSFNALSEREILALAIQLEEDSRVYGDFAEGLRESYPATAKIFEEMQTEESRHRQRLIDLHRQRFGDHIPLIQRQDVKGFLERRPVWLMRPLGIRTVRRQVEIMELETRRFYDRALAKVSDASTRKLLGDLADVERQHSELAESLERRELTSKVRAEEEVTGRRMFVLQVIQPGLAGLIIGRPRPVSEPSSESASAKAIEIPAPTEAAKPTRKASHVLCVAKAAAKIGASVETEPSVRGSVTGLMTAAGGLGHTLPFLISSFHLAFTVAVLVVAVELAVISYVRHRYMDTPLFSSALQVIVDGSMVFAVGILIGGRA